MAPAATAYRDAVTDREGQAGLVAHQFVAGAVVGQRTLGNRADQQFEQFGVDRRGSLCIAHHRLLGFDGSVQEGAAAWAGSLQQGHFQQGGQHGGAGGKIRRLQQGLLLARRERADHGQRMHQQIIGRGVD